MPAASSASAPVASTPTNALPIPSANVASVVNPMGLAPYDGPTGSVEGTVLVAGQAAPDVPDLDVKACPAALDTYGKLFRAGPARADGARPLADAVVAITGYQGFIPEKSEAAKVTIGANCAYPSRTIAVTFGQRVDIVNDSKLPFGPYLEGAFHPAVMIAPPERNGEPVKMYPPQAGYFQLRDRLQSFVRGDVWVMRNPLHAVSDTKGHFRVDGVPVGKQQIGAQLGAPLGALDVSARKTVDVRANVVENLELVLSYEPKEAGAPPAAGTGPRIIVH